MGSCVGSALYRARWTPIDFDMSDTRAAQRGRLDGHFIWCQYAGLCTLAKTISFLLCFQTVNVFIGCFCSLCVPAQLPAAAVTPKLINNWSEHKENALKWVRLPRGDGFILGGNDVMF